MKMVMRRTFEMIFVSSFVGFLFNHKIVSQVFFLFFIIIYCSRRLRKKEKSGKKNPLKSNIMQFFYSQEISRCLLHNRDNLLTSPCHINHKIFTRCFKPISSRFQVYQHTHWSAYICFNLVPWNIFDLSYWAMNHVFVRRFKWKDSS